MEKTSLKVKIPYILAAAMAVLIVLNIFVLKNRLFNDISPLRSSTRTMYADSYGETGEYPDLFLRNVVRDKEVKVAREIKTYDDYGTYGRDEEDGNPFDKQYLIENDLTRWFGLYAGKVTVDPSLPAGKEVSEFFSPDTEGFTDIGEANDMLRYSFALNREKVQQASAFWYSWYYNTYSEKVTKEEGKDMLPNIYVNLDGLSNAQVFVAVWTDKEDLYFMSEEKYREIRGK